MSSGTEDFLLNLTKVFKKYSGCIYRLMSYRKCEMHFLREKCKFHKN